MSRAALVGLLLILGTLFVACDPGIGITFVNNTDSRLCFYESDFETPSLNDLDPGLCNRIDAHETIGSMSVLCTSDDTKWVILTLGVRGREIYARSATCGEWEDSGATVSIEKVDGEFVVSDGLPGDPASP
jgi:hypothetical protein